MLLRCSFTASVGTEYEAIKGNMNARTLWIAQPGQGGEEARNLWDLQVTSHVVYIQRGESFGRRGYRGFYQNA